MGANTKAGASIRIVDPLEHSDWDRQIANFADATFFHTLAWARVIVATYGYRPLYLIRDGASGIDAILPLMEVDSWLTGRRGVSLPFTDTVDPLVPDDEAFRQLFAAARELAQTRKWKYLECRGGRKSFPEAPASTTFFSHILDLLPDERAQFSGFDEAVRRAVRKAEKSGVQFDFSQSPDGMRTFYQLMCKTRQRHGVPPQPYRFFSAIQQHVLAANHGWVILARHAGVTVAGAVYFHFGRKAIYKFGASDEAFQNLRGNNLVMWQAIRRYGGEGFATFDFGRTSLGNEGLRKFKLSWATREATAGYLRMDTRSNAFVTAPDESSGWHNKVFRALPMRLSELAGAMLYKHMG